MQGPDFILPGSEHVESSPRLPAPRALSPAVVTQPAGPPNGRGAFWPQDGSRRSQGCEASPPGRVPPAGCLGGAREVRGGIPPRGALPALGPAHALRPSRLALALAGVDYVGPVRVRDECPDKPGSAMSSPSRDRLSVEQTRSRLPTSDRGVLERYVEEARCVAATGNKHRATVSEAHSASPSPAATAVPPGTTYGQRWRSGGGPAATA